ncbi:hypothetical protein OJAV_G00052310, partial [Scomber scombrus]
MISELQRKPLNGDLISQTSSHRARLSRGAWRAFRLKGNRVIIVSFNRVIRPMTALTAQRSIEDAEELERERRRRARESFQTNGGSTLEESSPEGEMLAESL